MFKFLFGKPKIQSDEEIENYTKRFASACQIGFDAGEWVLPKKNNPLEIVIKAQALDTSALVSGEGTNEYRPTKWSEYIGQNLAKDRVQGIIEGSQEYNEVFPHTFLSGPAGHGKTLFASILASQLGKKLVVTTGGELKDEQILIDKVVECDGGIIFIDEANRINKKVGFFMLPLMEQFKLGNQNLKKFTILFASTHKGDLSKDLDALLQRCISIDLEAYTQVQLISILVQYAHKQYPTVNLPKDIYMQIAKNSRQTPRIAKNLLREYVYIKDFQKVLDNNQIIKDGITKVDIEALRYLSDHNGAGKDSLAKFLRVKPQTWLNEHEPYLVFQELIEIGSRRTLTQKGKDFLKEII